MWGAQISKWKCPLGEFAVEKEKHQDFCLGALNCEVFLTQKRCNQNTNLGRG